MIEEEFLKQSLEKLKEIKEGLIKQGFVMDFTQLQLLDSVKQLLSEIEDIETVDTF